MNHGRNAAKAVSLGGVLAALAVVVMTLGTIIPVATYVCPIICMALLQVVIIRCGVRIGWAWYGAVAVLSLLLAPDKEAAAVFASLGCYPIIKPWMDRRKLPMLWKAVYFNAVIILLYTLLLKVVGMEDLLEDFEEFGQWMTAVLLIMGNVTFFLMDRLLGIGPKRLAR